MKGQVYDVLMTDLCPTTKQPCHCSDRAIYANGQCWKLYRQKYADRPYQKNPEAKLRYETSEKGADRRRKYRRKRYAVTKITGKTNLYEAFNSTDSLRKIAQAIEEGNELVVKAWVLFTKEQQDLINSQLSGQS